MFLAAFARTVPAHQHSVMVLDQAGWHGAKALQGPRNVTLVPLPPYSPELVWGRSCQALDVAIPLRLRTPVARGLVEVGRATT